MVNTVNYYMTILASGPEREIQKFDWFVSGLELAVPSVNFRNKIKICQLWNKMANNFRTTLW